MRRRFLRVSDHSIASRDCCWPIKNISNKEQGPPARRRGSSKVSVFVFRRNFQRRPHSLRIGGGRKQMVPHQFRGVRVEGRPAEKHRLLQKRHPDYVQEPRASRLTGSGRTGKRLKRSPVNLIDPVGLNLPVTVVTLLT